MRILLTGSSGFIGHSIAEHLLSMGHEVVGVHRHYDALPVLGKAFDMVGDITSTKSMLKIYSDIKPCDAIIHAAACLNMDLFELDISKVNFAGLQNMLKLASQWHTSRFIFLSSVPVIGIPKFLPITEEHPTEPLTAYHVSKLLGEHLVRLVGAYGVDATILRLTAPIGPRLPRHRLLSSFVSNALSGAPLEISGAGTRRQNYIDVRDIARASELSLLLNAPGIFNIGSGTCISNLELANRCITYCNSSSQVAFNGQLDSEDGIAWDVSIAKARDILGFAPQYSLEDSIESIASGYLG